MAKSYLYDYGAKMTVIMKKLFPNVEESVLKEKIKEVISDYFSTSNVNVKQGKVLEDEDNIFTSVENSEFVNLVPINKIDRFFNTENPIISSSGVFFRRHDQQKNILADMCQEFLTKRKVYKKEMFKHINDEDRSIYNNFDSLQKNMKILNNSFFGASAEPNSIFYNPLFGPSITCLGQDIIMTAMNAFETFLSNSIEFRDITDVIIFCENILNEEYHTKPEFKYEIDNDVLMEYFNERIIDNTGDEVLKKYLNTLKPEDCIKIFYKNNFKEFLDDSDILDKYFSKIISRKDFLDPNDPPTDMKDIMEEIWKVLSDWVFYNYQNYYRTDNALNHKRKVVTTVDTDSNFVYLKPYLDYFIEKYPDIIDVNDNNHLISVIDLVIYQLTHVINKTCEMFTANLNVPEEYRPKLNFKNEFVNKRIMLTPNKKNYASIILMQEGNVFTKPKLDIKGLPIRKVSVNKNIRDYYTELLENDILNAEKINLNNIIYKYKKLEETVRNSLKEGNIDYVLPGKVNAIESYKEPYQIMTVRATLAWNIMFPEQEITVPNKINMIKINIPDTKWLMNYLNNLDIDEEERENYIKAVAKIYSNEKMVKNGWNVIALPQSLKKIPKVLIGLIDVDTITNDNINSGIIMLKSLGFKTLDILTNQYPTNIIQI